MSSTNAPDTNCQDTTSLEWLMPRFLPVRYGIPKQLPVIDPRTVSKIMKVYDNATSMWPSEDVVLKWKETLTQMREHYLAGLAALKSTDCQLLVLNIHDTEIYFMKVPTRLLRGLTIPPDYVFVFKDGSEVPVHAGIMAAHCRTPHAPVFFPPPSLMDRINAGIQEKAEWQVVPMPVTTVDFVETATPMDLIIHWFYDGKEGRLLLDLLTCDVEFTSEAKNLYTLSRSKSGVLPRTFLYVDLKERHDWSKRFAEHFSPGRLWGFLTILTETRLLLAWLGVTDRNLWTVLSNLWDTIRMAIHRIHITCLGPGMTKEFSMR